MQGNTTTAISLVYIDVSETRTIKVTKVTHYVSFVMNASSTMTNWCGTYGKNTTSATFVTQMGSQINFTGNEITFPRVLSVWKRTT